MLELAFAVLLFTTVGPATEYERVLVPLHLPRPQDGALDTRWRTELTVRNMGEVPATIFQSACVYDCSCVPITCKGGEPTAPRASFEGPLASDEPGIPAVLLHLERETSDEVAMSLRLRELTRIDHAGVEIPIVREDETYTGPFAIVGIPTRPDFRHHLRIYATSAPAGSAQVRITATREIDGTRFYDRVHGIGGSLPAPDDLDAATPGYLFLTIPTPGSLSESRFVVEVTPLTPGVRLWGMVSITHNDSQLVTIVSPQ